MSQDSKRSILQIDLVLLKPGGSEGGIFGSQCVQITEMVEAAGSGEKHHP